jgi:AraC-like DNA-binding protein
MGLMTLLREYEVEPGPILDSFGFKLSHFENPDYELPFITTSRFLARCVERTGCEHLGLLNGIRAEPSSIGIAGFMLRTARDVNTALLALQRHLDLHDQGGTITLNTNGEYTSLGYAVHLSGVSALSQIYDQSTAIACNIMRSLCGEDWNPIEVLLSRPRPKNVTPYKRFFKAPLNFNATESVIVFPTRWLKYKLPSEDPFLFEYLEKKAQELHQGKEQDLVTQVRQYIRNTLITNKCTASEAAKHIGIHERTLNRRLQDQRTNFRELVNEVRYALARSFLANSSASNAEIALALGYTDASTFNRSFKRWSDMSPAQWRNQHTSN